MTRRHPRPGADNDDAFTLGADTVTVPAGGTASVPITGDPNAVGFGRHAGYVVATDASTGKAVTRTSVGMVKEDERYNLTVKLVDRNGDPPPGGSDHEGRRLLAVGEYVEGDHPAHAAGHLHPDDVHGRQG